MPPGPAALAISTGAALVPAALSYTVEGLSIRFQDEIPVPAECVNRAKIAIMTQQLADAYAEGIAARPEDWHMLQRFWPADLAQATADPAADGLADAAAPPDTQPKTAR